ncbi:Neutral ceramidase [subsurface metagenome]
MKVKRNQKDVSLKAGVAKDIITPPIGTSLAGYAFEKKPSIGIHDELYVRAIVLEQGKTRVALAVCDVLGFERSTVEKVRRMVEEKTGIPHQNVIVAATHTHSGPAGLFEFKEYKNVFASSSAAYTGEKFDRSLVEILVRKIAGAIQRATYQMQEVQVGTLIGRVEEIGKNRRDPTYVNDPDVPITLIEGTDGPLSILYSYACHPTVMHQDNRLISADFPGFSNQDRKNIKSIAHIYDWCCR